MGSQSKQLLSVRDVLARWPMSRQYLWKLSTTTHEADRIPSYKIRGKRFYKEEEIEHYLDCHRYEPKRARGPEATS